MKSRFLYLRGLLYPIRLLALFAVVFLVSGYAFGQTMVVSSYFNASSPSDEWSELFVVQDNLNIGNWTYRDHDATQVNPQPSITFIDGLPLWSNLRAGTIIVIWHRTVSSTGVTRIPDVDPSDGYIELSAQNTTYFSGGSFGSSLDVAGGGDFLQIRDASNIHVHGLGHQLTIGAGYIGAPNPKLNHRETLGVNEVVMVYPGANLAQYGSLFPQNGLVHTRRSGVDLTFGLPNNSTPPGTTNIDFWRSQRQRSWASPNPAYAINANNTAVTLSWDPVTDPVSSDNTMGYIILRNTVDLFSEPVDGNLYNPGDLIGGAVVVDHVSPSTSTSYQDIITVPCIDGLYYRIYTYSFTNDAAYGYNIARGRAYNGTQYAAVHVTVPVLTDPTIASSDVTVFCANAPPADIALTADGSGPTLEWFTGSCGGTLIGSGNPLIISPPSVTTTYYARWNSVNTCFSGCEEVTVTVNPVNNHDVTISANPGNVVCEGEAVTVTATPTNSNTPSYQWLLNGSPVGTDQDTYTLVPVNGDQVTVEMTSTELCSANPATAIPIVFTVNPDLIPAVVIDPAAPSVCFGDNVTFNAALTNEGTTPLINWYVNNALQATTGISFSYAPADNDQVYAMLTSSETCATLATVNSNIVTVTVTASYTLAVTITADDTDVCENTTVIFRATVVSGGSGLTYEWYVNGGLQTGFNTATFSYIPNNGDQVYANMIDNASCAQGSPATSNTEIINVTVNVAVTVSLVADNLNICEGSDVIFTATPAFPGSTPVYDWYLNGALYSSGANPQFTLPAPDNGDEVYVILTSSEPCTSVNGVQSATLTISVTPPVTPTVELDPDQTSICLGSTVTFNAIPTGEGTNPVYVFHVNGAAQLPQNSPVFVWNPSNGDTFYVTLTSNALCATVTSVDSETETITVSSSLLVDIVLEDPGPVCSTASAVVFTATPDNQGATPVYEWYVNGSLAATTSTETYSLPSPANGDLVFVRLFNNETCATGSPDDSQTITVVVVTSVTPSLNILPDVTTVCSGEPVEFTADPDFGGSLPVYQWFVNGLEQTGITGGTLILNPAADISVYAVMQSNAQCADPPSTQSPVVDVTVAASYDVSVLATAPAGPFCGGLSVLVTAEPTNEGPAPGYQWYLNGLVVAGETNPDYSFVPVNGDEVYVELTNNETCANQHVVTSTPVQFTVNQPFVVSLSINPDLPSVCNGDGVTYLATPDNGGAFPSYQWFVNSIVQPETSGSFTYVPQPDDQVYAIVTSSETCVANATATSSEATVDVVTGPAVAISLSSNAGSACQGEPVTFTAIPVNEGLTPTYRWLVNGVADPAASGPEYTYVSAEGDLVTVELTSSETCATGNPAVYGEPVSLSPCGFLMRVPNAFTPDNNNLNDEFKPMLGDILPTKYLLQVFNRWGEIVFETSNPDQGWDGNSKGEPAARGLYIYKLEFEIPEYITNSLESPIRGFVMLLR